MDFSDRPSLTYNSSPSHVTLAILFLVCPFDISASILYENSVAFSESIAILMLGGSFPSAGARETINNELVGEWRKRERNGTGNLVERQLLQRNQQQRYWKSPAHRLPSVALVFSSLLLLMIGSSCCNALVPARLFRATSRGRFSKGLSYNNRRRLWQYFAAGTNSSGQTIATTKKIKPLSTSSSSSTGESPNGGASSANGVYMKEIELSLADGMVLRGQRWYTKSLLQQTETINGREENGEHAPTTTTKILALHGWLDNCRSFHYLAPKLIEEFQTHNKPAELVAIDLPGHGRSSHKPLGGPTTVLSEGNYYVAEAIDALGWGDVVKDETDSDGDDNTTISNRDKQGVALIGHSMGGSMAVTYAGVFPEHISRVVSIDIYGPEPGKADQAVSNIRSHVTQRRLGPRPHVLYPSLERAIERRQKAATLARGGNQYISKEAAKELVTRAMDPVYEEGDNNSERKVQGYQFLHDTRLVWPSIQYMTIEQIESVLEAVECPVCILAAEDGYPFDQDRIDRVVSALNPRIHEVLPGSHHLHADPSTADDVVDAIYAFFCSSENGKSGGTMQ